jgi:hypothetical protein
MALATPLCFDRLPRSAINQLRRPLTDGRDHSCRAAKRVPASLPLISRSISKIASIRFSAVCNLESEVNGLGNPERQQPVVSS